jgi:N,N-dimethylformamidase beta subunit-like protein
VSNEREDFKLRGYTNELSVRPGSIVRAYVDAGESYTASLVRLDRPDGELVEVAEIGEFPPQAQVTQPGSYVRVPHDELLNCGSGVTIDVRLFATLPNLPYDQGIVTKWRQHPASGWGLFLVNGRLVFRLGSDAGEVFEVAGPPGLLSSTWYHVDAGFSTETHVAYVGAVPIGAHDSEDALLAVADVPSVERIGLNDAPILIGAGEELRDDAERDRATGFYNGKLDNPAVFARGLSRPRDAGRLSAVTRELADCLVAAWDFSQHIDGEDVTDTGRHGLHGVAINAPMRGVTGSTWRAQEQHFAAVPSEYSAIYFHEDDLDDARWDESFSIPVSDSLASGAYAVRLVSESAEESAEDRIPFFVTPGTEQAGVTIAFLAPVFTYLAYGNEHLWQRQQTFGRDGPEWRVARAAQPATVDRYVVDHPELGRSIYDLHLDGSGVCYSSRLRPILNMRDDYRMWLSDAPRHFAADLLLLSWLAKRGFPCVVITDEILHDEGVSSLSSYDVVITGSHPEYWTRQMLDAMQGYLAGGGRLMYLGGNGFYWVTSVDKAKPHLIEVRRGNAGTRNWTSAPGESFHSTTGEFGGLWRHRGRPPQQLVGVGFTALGYLGAAGYARTAASYEPDVSFVFEGVEADVVGEFGLALNGAAGDELDRHDPALGSPPGSVVLATSQLRHDSSYQLCVEDIPQTAPDHDGEHDPMVRADMVYLPLPHGAAVFSVGSINWITSLAHNGGDNDIARITENVLRRFLS